MLYFMLFELELVEYIVVFDWSCDGVEMRKIQKCRFYTCAWTIFLQGEVLLKCTEGAIYVVFKKVPIWFNDFVIIKMMEIAKI